MQCQTDKVPDCFLLHHIKWLFVNNGRKTSGREINCSCKCQGGDPTLETHEMNLMDGGILVETIVLYALLIDEGPCGYL